MRLFHSEMPHIVRAQDGTATNAGAASPSPFKAVPAWTAVLWHPCGTPPIDDDAATTVDAAGGGNRAPKASWLLRIRRTAFGQDGRCVYNSQAALA